MRDVKAGDAIRKAIAQARATGGYDLMILDGPAMPWSADRPQAASTSPTVSSRCSRSISIINDSMEDIIAALDGAERKLVGVILNELNPTTVNRQRDKQYA